MNQIVPEIFIGFCDKAWHRLSGFYRESILNIVSSLVFDKQRVLTVLHCANLFTDMYIHVLTCSMLLYFAVKFCKNKIYKAAVLAQRYLTNITCKTE